MSKKIILSHIVAVSSNNAIGLKGKLPWDIPEDLQYFFSKTKNKILIMGRKTFESLGKALAQRLNIVLTRRLDWTAKNVVVFSDFKKALNYAKQDELIKKYGTEIFIGGGADIYKQTLPLMDRLYITRIHKKYSGDAFYPEIPLDCFKEVSRIDREKPEPFSFLVYDRIKK
ncbi:MAG: dihydrofolate reductase [Bdellovibrionaceae bacterium]|nr:dihydrofolate reductase [Pseudobdellovibrionaceae bacterium]